MEGTAGESGRHLTVAERELAAALIACVGGVEAVVLHAQLAVATATRGCDCGCGTIDFVFPGAMPERAPGERTGVVAEGDVVDADGRPVGGLLLFLDAGVLHGLEVWSLLDEPLGLPPVSQAQVRTATT